MHCVPAEHDVRLLQRDALVLEGGLDGNTLIVDGQLTDCERIEVQEELTDLGVPVDVEIDDRVSEVVLSLSEC